MSPAPMPPLAPLLARAAGDRIAARLRPFRERGVLASLDVHVVDQLGAALGEDDPEVLLGLALAVRAPHHGHICIDLASLEATDLLPEPEEGASPPAPLPWPEERAAWIERIARSPLVSTPGGLPRPFVLDGTHLYTHRYHTYQERLAHALRHRVEEARSVRDPALLRAGLEALFEPPTGVLDRQRLGAALAMVRGLTVISGGPGTGKTYTVRSILTLLWAQWTQEHGLAGAAPGLQVALAAPTGKAAARMRETIVDDLEAFLGRSLAALPPGRSPVELQTFLQDLRPSTLHRLLGWNPANPTRFRHDPDHPLPHQVVVVDEASMVDLALMTKLVEAVEQGARLILLGDRHQLASVEAGTVLADLCGPVSAARLALSAGMIRTLEHEAGLEGLGTAVVLAPAPGPQDAIVQFDRSRRFAEDSGIGRFARACLAEETGPRAAVEILRDPEFTDMDLLPHGPGGTLGEETTGRIVAGYRPYLERLLAGPREGETLEALHREALRLLDGFRILCAHRRGRLGVTGMNRTVVDLLRGARIPGFQPWGELWEGQPVLVLRNDPVVGRFNGDIGLVVTDREGRLQVAFPSEAGVCYLAPARLPEHEIVFAMTIHKSQGSEFTHALVVLPEQRSPILTRELVYTAVTRARERVTMLGDPDRLAEALTRTVRRASGLEEALWGHRAGEG